MNALSTTHVRDRIEESPLVLKVHKELGRGSNGCLFHVTADIGFGPFEGDAKIAVPSEHYAMMVQDPDEESDPVEILKKDLSYQAQLSKLSPFVRNAHLNNGQLFYQGDVGMAFIDHVDAISLYKHLYGTCGVNKKTPIPFTIASMAYGIAHALEACHSLEPTLVHGDVKPGNIIIERNTKKPYLIDFGCASQKLGKHIMGSAAYMSPEVHQSREKMYSPKRDVYALGSVIFQALIGETPYALAEKSHKTAKMDEGDEMLYESMLDINFSEFYSGNPKRDGLLRIAEDCLWDFENRYDHAGQIVESLELWQKEHCPNFDLGRNFYKSPTSPNANQ